MADTATLHIHDKVSKIQNYGILLHVNSSKSTVSSCHCEDRDANKLTQSVIATSSNKILSAISRAFLIGCKALPVPLLKLAVILFSGFNSLKYVACMLIVNLKSPSEAAALKICIANGRNLLKTSSKSSRIISSLSFSMSGLRNKHLYVTIEFSSAVKVLM